jgi:tripartite-type tricarboxylate transporter receptor subunit TctC
MVLESWFGLFAPVDTQPEIIKALNTATAKALDCPGSAPVRQI